MKNVALPLVVASAIHSVGLAAPTSQEESFGKRLENGLGRTPALGYNNWVAEPPQLNTIQVLLNVVTRTMEGVRMPLQMQLSKSQILWCHWD